ncbi:hypothetical protein CARUB_v10023053mg [Capsella rubella]|uniref:Cytochrome P450 n=1 Tax=Capsella rubella TaxID=81985 RepID=R0HSF3_9BRAS|nr:cytochrome P450 71B6 [Capsella rubella]EOA26958.1 hypothetical protein CARUB_v10023053mg [Capsella rubella]
MSILTFPMSTELLAWLVLLLLPSLLIIFLLRRSPKNLPPCPPRLPILGNIHQLGSLPHRTLRDLSLKYGPVITVYLGSVRTVVVNSPETAEEVLKLHDSECCTRPKLSITKTFFYDGLGLGFTKWGDYYREVRKLCVLELFSVKRANSFRNLRDEELGRLLNSLSDSAAAGTSVDLSKMLIKFVASFTCRMAFGLSFLGSDIDNDRFLEVFMEANRVIGKFAAADIFPSFGWIIDRISGLESSRKKGFKDLDTFYQKAIVDHREKKRTEEREDLIDVLLKLQSQETKLGSNRITDTHIRAILMDLFLAGVDATAITIDWTMAELVRHPRVMKKVQAEIRERVGDNGTVTYDDLEGLEYMKMVLKETWRLHIPSPILIPREAMTKFTIRGYDIYPGTRIHVNAWAIGRNPDAWKDPEVFFPERFIGSTVDTKGTSYELLPFGSGRRGCPAMYMGLSTVEYAVANLLYHFDWIPTGEVSVEEAPGLTSHRKHPLQVVPVSVKNRKL